MNIFKVDKIMSRLDKMLDHAISGEPIETDFDETKMSALETKLSRYLAMIGASKTKLSEEKVHIHELISDISHQTKTPLANILLYSQLLGEADLSDGNKLCVKSLNEQAEKLNFLIASLVKTSRLENGVISLTPILQPIWPMLEDILAQGMVEATQKGIMITGVATQASALFDRKWTAEAIYNIVDNAIKYTPDGGMITLSVVRYELFCRIDIADNGLGISEGDTAKIFARFYRSSAVSDTQGLGIGLYLAREIIGGQGGYIKVKSETGQGSTFSVFLPMEN